MRFILIFITLIISSFLANADEVSISQKVESSKQEAISVPMLDKAWSNRETSEGQSSILALIKKTPPVPENFEIAWRIARLVYFIGNFGDFPKTAEKDERVKIFQYGYESAEIAKRLEPNRVEGFFWYGINLGSYGLAKGIFTALGNAKAGRDALLKAAEIDPTYQWAGAYRIVGRYYQEVPSIISFGDKEIAEKYFKKAIQISPDFILNTMYLGILKEQEGDKKTALTLYNKASKLSKLDGNIEESKYNEELQKKIQHLTE